MLVLSDLSIELKKTCYYSGREGFAVRCGNLPVGVGKEALRMFIGEADVFPTHIILKRKKKSATGEKKQFVA